MSGKILAAIGQEIKRIAGRGNGGDSFPVMSGKVISVDEAAGTCIVRLSVDEAEAPTEGVLLNAVSANSNGQLLIPADNSQVWVAEIDGPGKWGLVKCSNLVKQVVKIGTTTLVIENGKTQWGDGSLGGMTKTLLLQSELAKNNAILTAVMTVINNPVPITEPGSGAPSALQLALKTAITGLSIGDFTGIENTKIKQS